MATLVCFHAHPDDESSSTAGTMRLAADAGHRVVLVVATRGERGEVVPGVLGEGEQLALRRTAEVHAAADVLGVSRVAFLGFVDSGMMGEPTNDEPWAFWQADVASAARRLAALLEEEAADALTIYDANGSYGHPDHIQVHRVGLAAAARAGVPRVLQSCINRTEIRRLMTEAMAGGDLQVPEGAEPPDLDAEPEFGVEEDVITHVADVDAVIDAKRAALRCHRSQIADDHFFLSLPDDTFARAFGREWYIGQGPVGGPGSPLEGIVAPHTA